MADSPVEICSNALTLLGAEPITSLIDDSERARLCNRHYPKSVHEMLRRAPWGCALLRVVLGLASTNPLFNWAHRFAIPGDCVRVWATSLDVDEGGDGSPWDIEGKFIVTNVNSLSILYVQYITDTLLFDSLLEKAITYDLAEKLAFPVTQNMQVQPVFAKMRDDAIKSAGAVDGQEGSKKRYRSTSLTTDVR
jgi:hypothetical protein